MKYDFDEQISRRGTDSYKWDSAENENVLPMWVADMDFRTAPVIVDALHRLWTWRRKVWSLLRKIMC